MRYRHFYTAGILFSLGLAVVGLALDMILQKVETMVAKGMNAQ